MLYFLLIINLALSDCGSNCPWWYVSAKQPGDGWCDLSCMIKACEFDKGDCAYECTNTGCQNTAANGVCDASCNFQICGYDFGDCVSCNSECTPDLVTSTQPGNGICDTVCMTVPCNFDDGDCASCCANQGCDKTAADGVCDWECDNSQCGNDFGDCGYCIDGCTESLYMNSVCDDACNDPLCNYDNGECV